MMMVAHQPALGSSCLLFLVISPLVLHAFHDCIQVSQENRQRKHSLLHGPEDAFVSRSKAKNDCAGGLCVGMVNGPHQGGNASYPVSWNGVSGTKVEALMTVPALPTAPIDFSLCYYIWTDVFFGDHGRGRMNQFVPQLILGEALDGSSGSPDFKPHWGMHQTWSFAAHYFFELQAIDSNQTEAHAAYGEFYPAYEGEVIETSFEIMANANGDPFWRLEMKVVGDISRSSQLDVLAPYMGMDQSTTSWTEPNYQQMCINSCWELYGAKDAAHLPDSGAKYALTITQRQKESTEFDFSAWVQDEGNGYCPSAQIFEHHDDIVQNVWIDIDVEVESMISTPT